MSTSNLSTLSTLTGLETGTWTIDAAHTEVGFVARHLVVTKVRGSFTGVEGTVVVADRIGDSSADVTVQMDTISTRSADRDGHLKSGDFFDVGTFPTMTFTSTSFDGSTLTGDLTIKGVTKPVT
ncbi:MAG: YceI family protein, partial [Nostocoides sp.]